MSLDTDDFCNTAFLTDMTVRAAVTSSLGHRQTLCACYCHQFSGTQTDSLCVLLSPVLWDTDRSLCVLLSPVLWDTDRLSVRAAVTSSLGHRQTLCACYCHQFSGTQTDSLCMLLSPVLWDTDRHSVRATVTSSLGHRQTLCACYCHQLSGIYLSHMFTVRRTFCHSWQCPVLFITCAVVRSMLFLVQSVGVNVSLSQRCVWIKYNSSSEQKLFPWEDACVDFAEDDTVLWIGR